MRRLSLAGLLVAMLLNTTGCVAWRAQTAPPADVLRDPRVTVIQVTLKGESKSLVYQPKIVRDTLTGLPTEMAVQRVTIPVADITSVATRYHHLGKTFLAGLAVVGGVALYGLLQSLNGTTP